MDKQITNYLHSQFIKLDIIPTRKKQLVILSGLFVINNLVLLGILEIITFTLYRNLKVNLEILLLFCAMSFILLRIYYLKYFDVKEFNLNDIVRFTDGIEIKNFKIQLYQGHWIIDINKQTENILQSLIYVMLSKMFEYNKDTHIDCIEINTCEDKKFIYKVNITGHIKEKSISIRVGLKRKIDDKDHISILVPMNCQTKESSLNLGEILNEGNNNKGFSIIFVTLLLPIRWIYKLVWIILEIISIHIKSYFLQIVKMIVRPIQNILFGHLVLPLVSLFMNGEMMWQKVEKEQTKVWSRNIMYIKNLGNKYSSILAIAEKNINGRYENLEYKINE